MMPTAAGSQPATPPRIALKVDVNTLRGTKLGVPRLMELFASYRAGATFLFSLGPDRTGRGFKRFLRRGTSRSQRAAVFEHYGLKTLLYGTLLPGPDIGKRCADVLRSVRDAGFETGVHCWDRTRWQNGIASADAGWTLREMQRAVERYESIFGMPPRVHGAAGWQMNVHSFRLTQRLGFDFCSDTRGVCPYVPIIDAEIVACPQIPTTLPTIAELIAAGDGDAANVAEKVLHLWASTAAPAGHVITLHPEIEGLKLLPVLDRLLRAWTDAGIEILPLGAYLEAASARSLPRHRTAVERIAGRDLAVQGPEFLPRAAAARGELCQR